MSANSTIITVIVFTKLPLLFDLLYFTKFLFGYTLVLTFVYV